MGMIGYRIGFFGGMMSSCGGLGFVLGRLNRLMEKNCGG